jgi:toxin ParE1/3/4
MRIVWTAAALDDLESIFAYYREKVGAVTAESVEDRIVSQIAGLCDFPERIRKSKRVQGTRELVINKLPYIAFVRLHTDRILVLNIVHTARKFPN